MSRRSAPANAAAAGVEPEEGIGTEERLLAAGLAAMSEHGYQATRVDDVVAAAGVSHGTFYLYFTNREALFAALARRCATDMTDLAAQLPPLDPSDGSRAALRDWLAGFLALYRRYGCVIRAWAENQVDDRSLVRVGRQAFGNITDELARRLRAGGAPPDELAAVAALGLIERFAYIVTSRDLGWSDDEVVDTLAVVIHRGFVAGHR